MIKTFIGKQKIDIETKLLTFKFMPQAHLKDPEQKPTSDGSRSITKENIGKGRSHVRKDFRELREGQSSQDSQIE